MIYPVPLFEIREWGTHIAQGHTCPSCTEGHLEEFAVCPRCLAQVFLSGDVTGCGCGHELVRDTDHQASLQCSAPECRAYYQTAFARHTYSTVTPKRVGSLSTANMPLFASVQHYLDHKPGEGSLHYADFIMDIDRPNFEDALSALRQLVLPLEQAQVPHQVYFSGSKGFHVVVPAQVVGAKPAADLNHVQYRKLADLLAELTGVPVDPAIYTRARLFREPLTVHGKTGLYKVPLLPHEYEQARDVARDPDIALPLHYLDGPPKAHAQMRAWFVSAQERNLESGSDGKVTGKYADRPEVSRSSGLGSTESQSSVMPCVQNALAHGPPVPGTRNKLNKAMASFFIAQGEDEDVMIDWARHTPGASSMPTLDRVNEARGTFRWAKRARYEFDCRDMREIGMCDPKCPLLQLALPDFDIFGPRLNS